MRSMTLKTIMVWVIVDWAKSCAFLTYGDYDKGFPLGGESASPNRNVECFQHFGNVYPTRPKIAGGNGFGPE